MRKAQASMEYVATYVYAGLALVVVVGAMGYFGAFDSGTYTKEKCESGEQLSCVDAQITADGVMGVMLTNNHDRYINITNYTLFYKGLAYPVIDANIIINPNTNGSISFDTTDVQFNKGKKESFNYILHYKPEGSNRAIQLSGTATTRVEEDIIVQCGNFKVESGEECDKGQNGGWIPQEEYSCEKYLIIEEGYNIDNTNLEAHGNLWCDDSCIIQRFDSTGEGCDAQTVCQGCEGYNDYCIQVSEWGFPSDDKYADNDFDFCNAVDDWVDCKEGNAQYNMCPTGTHCVDTTCVADDTQITCDCTDYQGACVANNKAGYDEDDGNLDVCIDGEWYDCDYSNPSILNQCPTAHHCTESNTCEETPTCDTGCTANDGSCGCKNYLGSCTAYNDWSYQNTSTYSIGDVDMCLGNNAWVDCDETKGCITGYACNQGDCLFQCEADDFKKDGWPGDITTECCTGFVKEYDIVTMIYRACCDAETDCVHEDSYGKTQCYTSGFKSDADSSITCTDGTWSIIQ